jgi:phage-related protein
MALDMTTALTIKAKVDGINQIQGLEKALGAADKQANGLGSAFGKLTGMAGKAAAAMTALGAAAVGGLAVLGKKAIDSADNLNDLSQKTGVGVEALSKFGAAAEDSGSSLDEVAKAMGKLAKGIVDPASKANEALRSIGVSSVDASGKVRSVDAVMLDIADKFSKLPDGAQKTALAMDIFGKSGANLIPMLNGGREAMSQYSATITTEMAQAADKFNDAINMIMRELAGPFNQAITASLPYITQLAVQLGQSLPGAIQALTPIITGLLQGLTQLGQWFSTLSPQAQTFVIGAAALTAGFIALAPAVTAIVAVFTTLGPLITGIAAAIVGIPAVIAGWAGAIGPLISALGTLGPALVAVFSGPVGWVALAAAAGVAIYTFRDQISGAFQAIGSAIATAATAFKTVFIDPVIQLGQQVVDWYINTWMGIFDFIKKPFEMAWKWIQENFIAPMQNAFQQAVQFIQNAWAGMQQIISAPFTAALNIVKSALNGIMAAIEGGINGAVGAINALIAAANRVPGVSIPTVSPVKLPRFAEGGVVTGPTIAMVGEGGEPEYIVPQSKASKFAANWMAGVRGAAAIPRFAEGGVVVPSANVSIQTGPVTQMNGANYVTTQDLSRAVQAGINQTLSLIAGDGSVRRQLGMA